MTSTYQGEIGRIMEMEIPKLKNHILTAKLNVAIEPHFKAELQELKELHNIDVPKWIREVLKREYLKLKNDLAS